MDERRQRRTRSVSSVARARSDGSPAGANSALLAPERAACVRRRIRSARRRHPLAVVLVAAILAGLPAAAFQVPREKRRFDALVIADPSSSSDAVATPVGSLAATDPDARAWGIWRASMGGAWEIALDRRSGAPLLAQGSGVRWFMAPGAEVVAAAGSSPLPVPGPASVEALESSLRAFVGKHGDLLRARVEELVLDRASSGPMGDSEAWQIVFDRAVDGIPVEGDRYLFHFNHGRLVAFGATRWTPIPQSPRPALDRDGALAILRRYMGLTPRDQLLFLDTGSLAIVPRAAEGTKNGSFTGAPGAGYDASLVWRFTLRVAGEGGTWDGLVDARTGVVVALEDRDLYAQVKGGVYPLSNDQVCPEGCEQPSYPMPSATVAVDGNPQTANASGLFECAAGGASATTALSGPYVQVSDRCGPVTASATCGGDLDLGSGPGTDCAVPVGSGPGNTHAARTGFYHLNRIIEKARAYLPSNAWLGRTLVDNVNIIDTCNAFWNGQSVNFYRSGNGCGNTGEIAGVFLHEWGHGLDQNDGGGLDNPSEAYADTAALLETHVSCLGRGFRVEMPCDGYGNACLDCTGVRDADWDARALHQPSTPLNFVAHNCQLGSAPCGGEVHCEAYITDEAMWDMATRDLPASGLDPVTAWATAERLWYLSRPGSGGRAYNCSLPLSDGCGASTWFTKMRAIDDDDGDLANGTPHAAAIFAAFARHGIACGVASDPSNQDHTVCPAIGVPVPAASPASQAAILSWTPAAGAASYRVLRGDGACASTYTPVAVVSQPSFTDLGLADGFRVHYAVQAVGTNGSCLGAVSACVEVVPQPLAGIVTLDRGVYACGDHVLVRVRDGNATASGIAVQVRSGREPAGETLALTPVGPGSPVYEGTLTLTADPPSSADGRLSVADGDAVTATYVDANDGAGGVDVAREAHAATDCVAPSITGVHATDVTGQGATIRWTTSEPADSAVHYGTSVPDGTKVGSSERVVTHAVALAGLPECRLHRYLVESTDLAGNLASDAGPPGANGYAFATGKNTRPVYTSADTPLSIPDDVLAGTSSTIVVSDDHLVRNVRVRVRIEHGFDADLIVSLVAPGGQTIRLAERRGGGAGDFTDTVFDDAAAVSIAEGGAPFLGSFRPEEPLRTLLGRHSAGPWRLHVQDVDALDSGRIVSWSLLLDFPDASCGTHVTYADHEIVEDLCASGGPGAGNGVWESGERARLSVRLENDGSVPLTGVHATITPVTAGVVMLASSDDYEDVPANATAVPRDPGIVAELPPGLPCGAEVEFQLDVATDQGVWTRTFSQLVGRPLVTSTAVINESFTTGIPAGWSIVNGGTGSGAASTWTTANPGGRIFAPPLVSPVAIVDSDRGGVDASQDEQLITPARDMRSALLARLEWDQSFVWYPGRGDEKGDVDIRSSATGGAWVNVRRNRGSSPLEPDHRSLDVTPLAAGAQNVQVRFHYYDASFEWWWQVDNVRLVATTVGGCAQSACSLSLLPPPVPDGIVGAPMTARRVGPAGSSIHLTWDVASCPAPGSHVLYGSLGAVASHQPTGAVCATGTSGSYDWTGVPAGGLWFLVVSDNSASLEGVWGRTSSGSPIGGSEVSHLCGMTIRGNATACGDDATP